MGSLGSLLRLLRPVGRQWRTLRHVVQRGASAGRRITCRTRDLGTRFRGALVDRRCRQKRCANQDSHRPRPERGTATGRTRAERPLRARAEIRDCAMQVQGRELTSPCDAHVRHALGMADYGQHGFHHPDFDTEPTIRVSPDIRGRVRVVPDSPGHLLRCTVGASGRFLDTDLKEVR